MISGIVFWRTQPASSLGGERAEEERRSKVSSNLEIKWQAGNNFGLRVASTVYFPKTHIHNSHVQQLYINYKILLRIIPPLLVTSCYIPFYDQYDPFNDQYVRSQLDFFANSHIIWVWYGRNWEPHFTPWCRKSGAPYYLMAIGVSS
jgi:hypothetical protein